MREANEPAGSAPSRAGEPEPAVLAAIVAAVEVMWPRPSGTVTAPRGDPSRWRFSTRWWSRPAASRRSRPW